MGRWSSFRYLVVLAALPGVFLLTFGIINFYFYYMNYIVFGDSSARGGFLMVVLAIAWGLVLLLAGIAAEVRVGRLQVSSSLIRNFAGAYGSMMAGAVLILIDAETTNIGCLEYVPWSGYVAKAGSLGPLLQCVQWGVVRPFVWMAFVGWTLLGLGLFMGGFEVWRQAPVSRGRSQRGLGSSQTNVLH